MLYTSCNDIICAETSSAIKDIPLKTHRDHFKSHYHHHQMRTLKGFPVRP